MQNAWTQGEVRTAPLRCAQKKPLVREKHPAEVALSRHPTRPLLKSESGIRGEKRFNGQQLQTLRRDNVIGLEKCGISGR